MHWLYLFLAAIFEMGWPLGFKLSQTAESATAKAAAIAFAAVAMAISGGLLWMAQKTIPIGTAYAVWTGIGAVGTVLIGIFFFNDSAGFWRIFCLLLIISGIIGLQLQK